MTMRPMTYMPPVMFAVVAVALALGLLVGVDWPTRTAI